MTRCEKLVLITLSLCFFGVNCKNRGHDSVALIHEERRSTWAHHKDAIRVVKVAQTRQNSHQSLPFRCVHIHRLEGRLGLFCRLGLLFRLHGRSRCGPLVDVRSVARRCESYGGPSYDWPWELAMRVIDISTYTQTCSHEIRNFEFFDVSMALCSPLFTACVDCVNPDLYTERCCTAAGYLTIFRAASGVLSRVCLL